MIALINKQPDIKIYISEAQVGSLLTGDTITGMSWSHIHKVASELSLKINTTIKDPTRNLEWTEIEISSDNGQEIRKEGAILGLRFGGAPKLSIVVRERISELNIGKDDKDQLQWGLESLESAFQND